VAGERGPDEVERLGPFGLTWVGLRGLEPRTSSLSGKPSAKLSSHDGRADLAGLSPDVRRRTAQASAVVTQLVTQADRLLRIRFAGRRDLRMLGSGPCSMPLRSPRLSLSGVIVWHECGTLTAPTGKVALSTRWGLREPADSRSAFG